MSKVWFLGSQMYFDNPSARPYTHLAGLADIVNQFLGKNLIMKEKENLKQIHDKITAPPLLIIIATSVEL